MTVMIRLGGLVVATVGARRAYVAPHVEQLPADDPHRELVFGMCEYALTVAEPGTYTDEDAIRWASKHRNTQGRDA